MTLETGSKDVHSGTTGGVARNPIGEPCQVIAECYDARTGEVKIPGFYKDVMKPTGADMAGYLASGFTTKEFQRAHELKKIRSGSAKMRCDIWHTRHLKFMAWSAVIPARESRRQCSKGGSQDQHATGAESGSGESVSARA
jgi:hypothetical protein